jgi:hypothetical protein
LNRPVEIEGGSLLGAILSVAGRAVPIAEELTIETAPSFGSLPEGPLAGLAAELYQLLHRDAGEGLSVIVTKSRDGVRIEATPAIDANRLLLAKAIAEKHLSDSPQGTRVSLRMDGASVVISSSSAPPAARKEPELSYIPLEPEAPPDEEPR